MHLRSSRRLRNLQAASSASFTTTYLGGLLLLKTLYVSFHIIVTRTNHTGSGTYVLRSSVAATSKLNDISCRSMTTWTRNCFTTRLTHTASRPLSSSRPVDMLTTTRMRSSLTRKSVESETVRFTKSYDFVSNCVYSRRSYYPSSHSPLPSAHHF
jgi:hypothetical protein